MSFTLRVLLVFAFVVFYFVIRKLKTTNAGSGFIVLAFV